MIPLVWDSRISPFYPSAEGEWFQCLWWKMQLKQIPYHFQYFEILNLKDETDKRKEDKEDQEQAKEYGANQLKHREEEFNAILAYRSSHQG